MKSGVSVVTDDVAKLLATISGMAAAGQVYVGIPDDTDDRTDGPIGNAAIGYINEFGSAAQGIPPRPFLGPGVEKVAAKCMDEQKKGIISALTSFSPADVSRGQNRAGLMAQNSVRAYITDSGNFKPLSETTLLMRKWRKGKGAPAASGTLVAQARTLSKMGLAGDLSGVRSKPLIDTGSLRTSITYVIRDE